MLNVRLGMLNVRLGQVTPWDVLDVDVLDVQDRVLGHPRVRTLDLLERLRCPTLGLQEHPRCPTLESLLELLLRRLTHSVL